MVGKRIDKAEAAPNQIEKQISAKEIKIEKLIRHLKDVNVIVKKQFKR